MATCLTIEPTGKLLKIKAGYAGTTTGVKVSPAKVTVRPALVQITEKSPTARINLNSKLLTIKEKTPLCRVTASVPLLRMSTTGTRFLVIKMALGKHTKTTIDFLESLKIKITPELGAQIKASLIGADPYFTMICPIDLIKSCFSSGHWINVIGWNDEVGWNNEN